MGFYGLKFRKNAISNLIKTIEDEDFNCRSKNGFQGAFTRERKLSFKNLIVLLTKGLRSSIQRELDSFYKELSGSEFNIRKVTKGAFTQARAKLKHESFIELNQNVVDTFYNEAPYIVWHNMRLLAVDGTRLVLPNHPTIKAEFGEHGFGPNADSNRSLAVASFLYDPLNLLTLDAQIAPYSASERDLLLNHLEKVNSGDLLLLDRGYPSFALFFLLCARGIEFCVRMKDDWWLEVKRFKESGQRERIVEFRLPKKDRTLLKDHPEYFDKSIKCRLIRIDLPNGEVEILCTSLIDIEKYKWEDFEELYHFRWNIEENYKLFKVRIEIENFSGKTALSVKQDFYAKVFMMSLCATLAFPIEAHLRQEYKSAQSEERVKKEKKNKKNHPKKINHTNALAMMRNICVGAFLKNLVQEAIKAFDKIVYQTTEIVRPNRTYPRPKKLKKLYYMNYKPL